jgi:hypothetical protein
VKWVFHVEGAVHRPSFEVVGQMKIEVGLAAEFAPSPKTYGTLTASSQANTNTMSNTLI